MQEKQIKLTAKNIHDLLLKFDLIKKEAGAYLEKMTKKLNDSDYIRA